jgi:hypothetical protein
MSAAAARPVALHAAVGAGLAALCALAPADLPPALAVLAAITLPAALLLAGRSDDAEGRALLMLFLAAVAVRTVVAIFAAYAVGRGFFSVDDHRYGLLGWELARHWAGEGPFPAELYGRRAYYAWNALIYTVVGHVPLAPALANAAFGGLTVVVVHAIARDLAGPRAGLLAALLAGFWPSLVLWSSLNLKDTAAVLAILVLLRGAQRLQTALTPAGLLLLAGGLAVLASLRGYLALVALTAVGLAWLVSRLRALPVPLGAVLVVVLALGPVFLLPSVAPIEELADEASFESLDEVRRKLAFGGSAYRSDADLSTPRSALRFLPVGLAYFLLAPAPWQLWNARQLLTLPEMLAWYALLPLVVRGISHALRRRFVEVLPLAAFVALATLSYALVEGNLGTAYRHRAQVLVLYLLFAAVGIAARRPARAPAPAAALPAAPCIREALA